MKFILLSVVCLLGAAVAKPALTKQKRDILPGDPRYGTDYHHNHHHAHEHHHGLNEVEVAPAIGGYVGSYNVPDNTVYENNINFQPLSTGYGPPNFTAGKPIFTPHISGTSQKTVHQQVEVPAFPQQSTISNFKTAENVETISSGYRAPVQTVEVTPVPTYQPVVHQQTVVDIVQKPVDSYGIPIPESVYTTPTTETQQRDDVIKYVEVTPAVPDDHEDQTVQDTPVQHDVSVKAHAKADSHVEPAVRAGQTQEHVNHVDHGVQPAVPHYVQKTAKSPVQQQNFFQQSVQQFPDFYAGLSSDKYGGSFDGFRNFGSLDSGFQSYGVPSNGPSGRLQSYDSGFGNVGYGYQQDFNGNQYQGSYSNGAVQQDSTVPQFPQISGSSQNQQFPQYPSFVQNPQLQVPSFVQYPQSLQVPSFVQNPQLSQVSSFIQNQKFPQVSELGQYQPFTQVPSFLQGQQFPQISELGQYQPFPQVPSFGQKQQGSNVFPSQIPNFVSTQRPEFSSDQQEKNQANLQPTEATVTAKSDSVNVKTFKIQQIQPAGVQINTDSNTNSFVKQSSSSSDNSGYVY